jgi:hypothetical protein
MMVNLDLSTRREVEKNSYTKKPDLQIFDLCMVYRGGPPAWGSSGESATLRFGAGFGESQQCLTEVKMMNLKSRGKSDAEGQDCLRVSQ